MFRANCLSRRETFLNFVSNGFSPLADNLTLASLTAWPGRVLYVPLFPLQHLFFFNFTRFAAGYFFLKNGGSKQRTRSLLDYSTVLQALIISPAKLSSHRVPKTRTNSNRLICLPSGLSAIKPSRPAPALIYADFARCRERCSNSNRTTAEYRATSV